MGSYAGVQKIAARRIGVPLEAYLARIEAAEKWCDRCKTWRPIGAFGEDRTRGDGRDAKCKECRRSLYRAYYMPKERPPHRPCYSPGGNPQSARVRIYQRIKRGELPHPNMLACCDCGHIWSEGQTRHEYDHTHGYEPANALTVEAVCTRCHNRRGRERGTHIRKHGSNGRFSHGCHNH
jgi:hypothetical protein